MPLVAAGRPAGGKPHPPRNKRARRLVVAWAVAIRRALRDHGPFGGRSPRIFLVTTNCRPPASRRQRAAALTILASLALSACASTGRVSSSVPAAARLPPVVVVEDGAGRSVPLRLEALVDGGRLVSGVGWRGGRMGGSGGYHEGLDITAPRGAPVRPAAGGVVAELGRDRGYGRFIRIRHGYGLETFYAHLSQFGRTVAVGSQVAPGDVIGYVGSTGRSSGPHLHFEVRRFGRPIDPLAVTKARVADGRSGLR